MEHYEHVLTALAQHEFTKAAQLLKQWQRQNSRDPWLPLAVGRYLEATDRLEQAEATYRQVLQQGGAPRLITQARQGLRRLQETQSQLREHALSRAKAQFGAEDWALLLLKPVQGEARQMATQGLAKIMQLDVYSARMLVPGKYWRLYRVGASGELQFFAKALQENHTPAFWFPFEPIRSLPVFEVKYIQQLYPEVQVICQNPVGQLGTLSFSWTEVSQRVLGKLPIFESVVDLGPWGKLERKEKTQDYAEALDLHLFERSSILRLCNYTYQYNHGVPLESSTDTAGRLHTAQQKWTNLLSQIGTHLSTPCWTDFTGFGESAIEFMNLLPSFKAHLTLRRKRPSNWDCSFHLYSYLRYLHHQP